MSRDRIVAIVLAVLLVVTVGFAVNLNQELNKSEKAVVATTTTLDDTKGELKDTSQELLAAQDEVGDLSSDLASAESAVDDFNVCVTEFGNLDYYRQGAVAAVSFKDLKSVYLCFANLQGPELA